MHTDGATADPQRYMECFMDESWIEHLRHDERASVNDREIQRRAKVFLFDSESVRSQHWLDDRDT